jgi:membrane-associated phospholipid phosphatase
MIGLCALTFFIVGLSIHNQLNIIYTIATLFLLIGLVASSRLYMKAHTITELIIGIVIGVVPQIASWYFWL